MFFCELLASISFDVFNSCLYLVCVSPVLLCISLFLCLMAKGFRLSKGFLKELRRLSKEACLFLKRLVCSEAVDPPKGNR